MMTIAVADHEYHYLTMNTITLYEMPNILPSKNLPQGLTLPKPDQQVTKSSTSLSPQHTILSIDYLPYTWLSVCDTTRSDALCLQSIADKQAIKLADNALRIEKLENREMLLTQNVEALLAEIKETEEEIGRWREACELEVKAGNKIVEEHDKLVNILKKEIGKIKAALDTSNLKIKLKDDLVADAVSAREAAERSLRLADSRAAGDHERIEELTRQLEEAEKKDTNRHRVRHICWPWKAFKLNPTNNTANGIRKVRHTLPEMQAFLHYH